jgi:predicted flap endonuclease-1-like 5' DNA nuclease
MKQKHSFNFMVGLLIGGLVGLLFWYWQKSTSAEDGALTLLDKLAATEKRVRQLKSELADGGPEPELLRNIPLPSRAADVPSFLTKSRTETADEDDLTQVKGIGAVFNGRLQQANIHTFAQLQALSAEKLATILQIRLGRAENILAEAENL